ncbi:MAG TPA: 5-(carboxyamino)imidazole ribonucleotide synthase [Fibrobacteria bacterium]|nr:5-(carboxyamino)imidazole ribonucleotide synthase [Fibrobacteria bacterium]
MRTVLPGATLGILGGGQLGRMFVLEAKRMGYRVITLEPSPDSPCGQVADEQIEADYADESALRRLAERCDAITYEFENIDARAVEFLEGLGKAVHPGSRVLRISQDRLLEKNFLRDAGLAVAAFMAVDSPEDMREAAAKVGLPAVIKTVRGGYDGKGQAVVADASGAEAAFRKLHRGHPLIWERKIPFLKELSVVACRGIDGAASAYPVSENVHVENILDTGVVPARISAAAAAKARSAAETVGNALGIVGAYCVELFLVEGDGVLVNEIAPRPHNSGHYTLDACVCSQFEQQVRAICGLPLGSTEALKPSAMVNVLGDGNGNTLYGVDEAMREGNLVFHLYGKSQAAAKRKMGHYTVLAETAEAALAKARAARALLRWG